MADEFLAGLERLRDQGRGAVDIPFDTPIYEFFQIIGDAENIMGGEDRAEGAQIGPDYYAMPVDHVVNGSFEADLTGWTESIDANHTATTAQTTTESKAIFSSLGSLEIDITASTDPSSGRSGRLQQIAASPGEVWNIECWLKGSAFTNSRARFLLQWRNSGQGALGFELVTSTDVSGDFVRLAIQNVTAPANTAFAEINVDIQVTQLGGTGKCWFDLVRAEKGLTSLIPLEEAGVADIAFAA